MSTNILTSIFSVFEENIKLMYNVDNGVKKPKQKSLHALPHIEKLLAFFGFFARHPSSAVRWLNTPAVFGVKKYCEWS